MLIKKSKSQDKVEIDIKKLIAILKTLKKENNIEIIHLSIQSMLDELED